MKKTYNGHGGSFDRGRKYDLPEATVKHLPKKYYNKTCAPWDEMKDHKTIARAKLKDNALESKARFGHLAEQSALLAAKADELVHPAKAAHDKADKAEKAAVTAGKKAQQKSATEKQKQNAWFLARNSERLSALRDIAQAELMIALGKSEIARLDVDDAKRKTKKLCKKAGIEFEPEQQPEVPANTEG